MTKPDFLKTFTQQQQIALDALATGANITKAAEAAGVTRQTVHVWLSNDNFKHELTMRRNALWDEAIARLNPLTGKSLDVLDEALERGGSQAISAAKVILQASGLLLAATERVKLTGRLTALIPQGRATTYEEPVAMSLLDEPSMRNPHLNLDEMTEEELTQRVAYLRQRIAEQDKKLSGE